MISQMQSIIASAALLGVASGHMIMNTPTPYNLHHSTPLVQVSPLGPGLPFPCQGNQDIEQVTTITAGATQLVNFTGGAQHGGGSCQFSLTYEYPPPADKSKWKTIYTLIGGCPVSAAGNLPTAGTDADGRADSVHCGNDSGTECIRQFEIPIPKGVPSGNATFAWTWYNKIGNRELYMNCAPVSITDGASDTTFFDALPQMFVANIPGECTTNNGVLNIPNPGSFGKVLEQPAPDSEGTCEKAAGIPTFDSAADSGSGSGSGSGSAPPPPPPPPATTSSSDATPPAATDAATSTPPPPTATETPAGGSGSCSPDGAIVCLEPGFFGICDHGFAVKQALAPGTTCAGGQISRRSGRFFRA
ncbi:hypothetical protein B0T24DRAFT_691550 [Lasiosphaeria ovina]|uniref:Lytic polysaccharide monooxygenase n=1 Tax=Lasiosphaeria ovina TaxID=92902 RepID=A0AAE0JU79_9PEZI|nr:hypothetical protein B0T24DRAFT_691550 [Lasiosphaeria ovina]